MDVVFQAGWDIWRNHTSHRSQDEVERIVKALGDYDALKKSPVATADTVKVVKGIHNDSMLGGQYAHITVLAAGDTYHIYLTRDYMSRSTFAWEPALVVQSGLIYLSDPLRNAKYNRNKTLYPTSQN